MFAHSLPERRDVYDARRRGDVYVPAGIHGCALRVYGRPVSTQNLPIFLSQPGLCDLNDRSIDPVRTHSCHVCVYRARAACRRWARCRAYARARGAASSASGPRAKTPPAHRRTRATPPRTARTTTRATWTMSRAPPPSSTVSYDIAFSSLNITLNTLLYSAYPCNTSSSTVLWKLECVFNRN